MLDIIHTDMITDSFPVWQPRPPRRRKPPPVTGSDDEEGQSSFHSRPNMFAHSPTGSREDEPHNKMVDKNEELNNKGDEASQQEKGE
jgi:hypothetical protein